MQDKNKKEIPKEVLEKVHLSGKGYQGTYAMKMVTENGITAATSLNKHIDKAIESQLKKQKKTFLVKRGVLSVVTGM